MEKKALSAAVVTLGCARNEVESDFARGSLRDSGFKLVERADEAEVIIVNTCGFIEPAKQQSIDTVLELAQFKEKGKCRSLILAGCLGERYSEELFSGLPEVDAVVGISSWSQLESIVSETLAGKRLISVANKRSAYGKARRYIDHSPSAFLQIADGCSRGCSYCAIPRIRGKYRSRPLPELVEETGSLVRAGAREINLIAQDTSQYGLDLYGKIGLVDLLDELSKLERLEWIRLLYFDPSGISQDIIERMATGRKICHYLDIPFQHGSARILKEMRRPGTKEEYLKSIENLRDAMPDVALRTSVIVGFPGETEAEFGELAEFVREAAFDYLGVFQFSPEEGTKAFSMPAQVPPEVRQERYHLLMALQEKIRVEKNRESMGRIFEVLVERKAEEAGYELTGRNPHQAPEVDGEIHLKGKAEPGELIKARIEKADVYDLFGEQVW
jgi:ribosomal protein S12 methylthiotransferase